MTRGMLYFPRMLDKIRLHARGDLTINYLDTHGLPLTAEHLASAMALVAKIAGVSADEDKQLAREAQIARPCKCPTPMQVLSPSKPLDHLRISFLWV